jgi:hypothetical protein
MPTLHASEEAKMAARRIRALASILALALLVGAGGSRALAAAVEQEHFATPEAAVEVLVAALRGGEQKAMLAVLGPDATRLVDSGDAVADREARERFVSAYEQKHTIEMSGETRAVLELGDDGWPMPIPIVKDDAGWRFDTKAGEQEILDRRIGRNELSAIQSCLAYVDAQREYYERDPDKSGLLHYAARIASTKGKRDGLYYPTGAGEPESPLGALFATTRTEGYKKGKAGRPTPYHGYYFRVLTAQGPHAKGGAYDYMAKGKLLGGFALVAYPATWGTSGVMTFLVNHEGVVYEKDLGPKTAALAQAMKRFDPDSTWKAVPPEDEVPPQSASAQ